MMYTISCMNLLQNLPVFLWRYTPLVDSCGASVEQLPMDHCLRLASPDKLSFLDFVLWKFPHTGDKQDMALSKLGLPELLLLMLTPGPEKQAPPLKAT